jgi:hypothetical protein
MNGQQIGSLELSEIRRRLLPCQASTDIPNGVLWTLDILPSGEIAGHIKFNKNEFLPATMIGIADDYQRILANALAAPGTSLDQICRSASGLLPTELDNLDVVAIRIDQRAEHAVPAPLDAP